MRFSIANLLLVAFLATPIHAQANASVEGIVADRVTGAGIPNVPITIYTRQAVRYETTSGPDGHFRVTGMAPGIYETRVAPSGYQLYRNDPSQMEVAPLSTGHVRVELTKQVAIHGRVVDPDGKPAAGVQIKYASMNVVATNAAGEFTIKPAGLGYARLSAAPSLVPRLDSSGQRVSLVPTFYPSAIDPGEAQSILVRGDGDISNIEIHLQSVPVYRVQGRLLDEAGNPNPGAIVRLVPIIQPSAFINGYGSQTTGYVTSGVLRIFAPATGPGIPEAQATTDPDGTFEFPAVHGGDWQVMAEVSGSRVVSFTVAHADVLGLELGASAASFHVTSTRDASALSGLSVPLPSAAISLTLIEGGFGANPARQQALPNVTFQVSGLQPGKYFVSPGQGRNAPIGGGPFYTSAILFGGVDVMGKAVDLTAESPPFLVIYKPAEGGLRGRVTNSDAATVLMLPQNPSGMQAGYFAQAQKDGSFEFDNLPPGDYAVGAFDRLELNSLSNDPVFVRRAIELGKHVKMEASPIAVELTASRWPE